VSAPAAGAWREALEEAPLAAVAVDPTLDHLPSGRHGLAPEFVQAHQRERLLRGISDACFAQGYPSTTIADIVSEAGVSRRTFYSHFSGKEECFLEAYRMLVIYMEGKLASACAAAGPAWPERLAAALRELLDELARQPSIARTLFVDVLSAGPRALAARQEAFRRHVSHLRLPAGAPPELGEAVGGGIAEMVYHTILAGGVEELPGMYEELLYCLLLPLLGHGEATAVCGRASALTKSSS
jgi:AcrR family transcriptional regulator